MARAPGGADDEYQELQKRFQTLESERKNLFEHTQLEVKKNKETLAKLKSENKDLRSSLSSLMSDQGKNTNSAEVNKLEKQVADMRRNHDDVKHQLAMRQKQVDSLQDKLKDLEKEISKLKDDDTPLTRNIRTLENRLDKAMIKYNEAQSIHKTYEQIVKRLKEERIGFDNQLAAIERTLKAKEKDLEELVLMSHDAQHAKEVAKGELLKLEYQLLEEKKTREKELSDRRALVQQKVEINQRMEKRDKMRREMALVEGEAESGDLKNTMFSSAFHSALNEHVIEEEHKKITTYEEAFRKIKDATGVSDVNEVIQKFLTQDETHNNLVVMTKEAQARIDALNEEKAQAKAKVEEIKYSGTGSLGSRRIVDEFESHLADASSKCERNKQKYERIARILINVKSGVEHLADKLEPILLDQEPVPMTDSTVVEVLAQCEAKLIRLLESEPDAGEEAEEGVAIAKADEQDKLMASQEVEMPVHNIRIQIPHDADDDSGEDDMEEEDQEDVPDRDQVKKYSSLMLEKANKKQKRQRKKKSGEAKGSKSGGTKPEMA